MITVADSDFYLDPENYRAWIRVAGIPNSAPAVWEQNDKPCSTCNDRQVVSTGTFDTVRPRWIPCPDCFNGRHALEITVGDFPLTVAVVPNRIVPVEDSFLPSESETPYQAMIILNGDTDNAVLHRRSRPDEPYARYVPFRLDGACVVPATTVPGDWLVQIEIAEIA